MLFLSVSVTGWRCGRAVVLWTRRGGRLMRPLANCLLIRRLITIVIMHRGLSGRRLRGVRLGLVRRRVRLAAVAIGLTLRLSLRLSLMVLRLAVLVFGVTLNRTLRLLSSVRLRLF